MKVSYYDGSTKGLIQLSSERTLKVELAGGIILNISELEGHEGMLRISTDYPLLVHPGSSNVIYVYPDISVKEKS